MRNEIIATKARAAWFDGLGSSPPSSDLVEESLVTFNWAQNTLEKDPLSAIAHNNLGWALQVQGNVADAISHYERALDIDPSMQIAKRNLSTLLILVGRLDEGIKFLHQELTDASDGYIWMRGMLMQSMAVTDLSFASNYAAILAELRWGSNCYIPTIKDNRLISDRVPSETLTVAKLEHDIEQFEYLRKRGLIGEEFEKIEAHYRILSDRIASQGPEARILPGPDDYSIIGGIYNRILNIRHTPRLKRVFSEKWTPAEVEQQYIDKPPGVVVIDDFLTTEALENLVAFCLESTIWNGNRFSFGRLGSFFQDGFNCQLLVQIAEELRKALPKIITPSYPLREIWGFKCGQSLDADSTIHADYAAVNANFWITPDEANMDQNSGGLVIYGVGAPSHWAWDTYNGRLDVIKHYLRQQNANRFTIPYRQNRAIIFNSDIFHATDEVKFKPGYENRRVNITMLYGDRQNDQHYPAATEHEAPSQQLMWKSKAFSRFRH
jgi:tetratricopeptide (TPR) repeat protein